jgi:hypothetical protein
MSSIFLRQEITLGGAFPRRKYHHCITADGVGIRKLRRRRAVFTAALVPRFPRLVEQVKDFIAPSVPQLEGFNADDLNRILIPDVVSPGNLYTLLLLLALVVAALNWEWTLEDSERDWMIKDSTKTKTTATRSISEDEVAKALADQGEGHGLVKATPAASDESRLGKLRRERRRGLAWLALVTAVAIWCTGVLNKGTPFQP